MWTSRRDFQIALGEQGCELQCAAQTNDGDLVIGRSEAVYFYMPESPGNDKNNFIFSFFTFFFNIQFLFFIVKALALDLMEGNKLCIASAPTLWL